MVVDPDYTDREEANHVGGVGGPVVEQRICKPSWLDLRDFQFQYQEGRRDSEDTVTKCLGAASAHRASLLSGLHGSRALAPGGPSRTPQQGYRRYLCGGAHRD